jgi:hypothetical protein
MKPQLALPFFYPWHAGKCKTCTDILPQKLIGRPREYCNNACKQKLYRQRLRGRLGTQNHLQELRNTERRPAGSDRE